MLNFLPTLVCVAAAFVISDCARILAVFPTPSVSHQFVFRPLTRELAKRGHEVVVITTDPAYPKGQAPANLTEIDVHDVSYNIWHKRFLRTSTGQKHDLGLQVITAYEVINELFEKQMQADEVQSILKDESRNFDLLILEAWTRPSLGLSYRYRVPVIQVGSFGPIFDNCETIGAATNPIYYPISMRTRIHNLTLWEKVKQLYEYVKINLMVSANEEVENKMLQRVFGSDIPPLRDLKNNVDMAFYNVYPIWDSNRPVPPSVVYIGGIHQNPVKELPKDLKEYLDSSVHGVIYLSFGTNVDPAILSKEKLLILVKVMSEVPYNVIWRWHEELPGRPKNIRVGKWFPQSDLLRHPKVKLFITQGGLQSSEEAIVAGVPLLGIPFVADQWFNTEQYEHFEIGKQLDVESLTEDRFRDAVNKIIDNERYRHNVAKLRELIYDQPQTPLQRAVWWTEHVLRHGGARHLRARTANMSWADYLELRLLAVVLGVMLTLTFFLSIITRQFFSSISCNISMNGNKKSKQY